MSGGDAGTWCAGCRHMLARPVPWSGAWVHASADDCQDIRLSDGTSTVSECGCVRAGRACLPEEPGLAARGGEYARETFRRLLIYGND